MPARPVKLDLAVAFQRLLSIAHVVLPFLTEVYAIDYPVDGIVAKVGLQQLNQRMKFLGSEWPLRKQKPDGVRKDSVRRFSSGLLMPQGPSLPREYFRASDP